MKGAFLYVEILGIVVLFGLLGFEVVDTVLTGLELRAVNG